MDERKQIEQPRYPRAPLPRAPLPRAPLPPSFRRLLRRPADSPEFPQHSSTRTTHFCSIMFAVGSHQFMVWGLLEERYANVDSVSIATSVSIPVSIAVLIHHRRCSGSGASTKQSVYVGISRYGATAHWGYARAVSILHIGEIPSS
jgi:hypothetical protein